MLDYITSGYDSFLSKEIPTASQNQEFDPLQVEQFTQEISGSKVQGGVFSSISNHLIIDLENEIIRINDGIVDKITLGKIAENTFGLLAKDNTNKEIMRIDNDGLSISNGKLSIKNSNNEEIISNKGLTIANFPNGFTYKKNAQILTGDATFQRLNDFELSFTLRSQALVFFIASISWTNSGATPTDANPYFRFILNNEYLPLKTWFEDQAIVGAAGHTTLNFTKVLAEGKYTIGVEAARSSPDATITIEAPINSSLFDGPTYLSHIVLGGG